jgi:dienelactone hydrolase
MTKIPLQLFWTLKPTKNLLVLAIGLLLYSCHDECPSRQSRLYIKKGTTQIMLNFTSKVDGQTIPLYLAFPPSQSGLLKAVVVLHGSGGPWDDDDTNGDGIGDLCNVGQLSKQNKEWEALLISKDYAVAFPDSYSPRNTCENEGDYKVPPLKFRISGTFIRNRDAEDVLELLSRLVWKGSDSPVIDISNVALLGFSDGGTAVLSTSYDEASTPVGWQWKQSFDGVTYTKEILPPSKKGVLKYKTAVAYYPGAYHNGYYGNLCNTSGIYRSYCEILFHLAEDDPLTSNADCLISTMASQGGGESTVHRYVNTDHGFDGNDEPESEIARARTIAFLQEKFRQ